MISTKHTQSLSKFRANASETLNRLNKTGKAEVITVNGEARAVVMSPAAFDEIMAQDIAGMRHAIEELDVGKGLDARKAFASLRAEIKQVDEKKRRRK